MDNTPKGSVLHSDLRKLLLTKELSEGKGSDISRYAKPAHVAWVHDGERVIVLHMDRGEHLALSPHATRVWELTLELAEPAAVVAQLVEEYAADPAVVGPDVDRLLADLVARDLLCEETAT